MLRYEIDAALPAEDWSQRMLIPMPGPAKDDPRDGDASSSEESLESETPPPAAAAKAAAKAACRTAAKAAAAPAVPHPPALPPPPPPPREADNFLSDSDSVDSLGYTHGKGRRGGGGTEPAREAGIRLKENQTREGEKSARGKGRADRVREPAAEAMGSKPDGRDRETGEGRHERGREPHRAHHKRRERRDSSKGKGKDKGKSRRCPHCYQRVSSWPSSFDQHQFWSESCLAWQAYNRGNGRLTWEEAQNIAAETKERRQRQHDAQLAREARDPLEDEMTASKKAYEATVAHMKKGDHYVEGRAKKGKAAKKKRREEKKLPSPSPSPPRRGGPHRKPPGSDSEDERPSGARKRKAVAQMLKALVTCL